MFEVFVKILEDVNKKYIFKISKDENYQNSDQYQQ